MLLKFWVFFSCICLVLQSGSARNLEKEKGNYFFFPYRDMSWSRFLSPEMNMLINVILYILPVRSTCWCLQGDSDMPFYLIKIFVDIIIYPFNIIVFFPEEKLDKGHFFCFLWICIYRFLILDCMNL